jgi:hypothetical protein
VLHAGEARGTTFLVMRYADGDERGGYRITPLQRPAGSAMHQEPTRPQPSAPTPGPTEAVALPQGAGGVTFAARMTPF